MPIGRPSKYNELTLEITENYIRNYAQYGHAIPSNAGLSIVLGVHRDTVQSWANDPDKAAFSDMLVRLQSEQEQILLSKGLTGEYNSNIAKLVLAKHGYADKSDVNQNITIHEKTIDDLE
jgi:hypothetical protein